MQQSSLMIRNKQKSEVIEKYKRVGMEIEVTKVIYYGETE